MAFAAVLVLMTAACSTGFGRQYEYDEQLYLNADGSATVVVNASIPALVALRGLALDPAPRARVDRNEVRRMVQEPGLEITRVSRPWRRDGRQFIQIRAEIEDVEKLGQTKLFGWSEYDIYEAQTGAGATREYRQRIGAPAGTAPAGVSWDGSELVAFKLHLPSRIHAHNVRDIDTNETGAVARGNILTWEQRLPDRLAGAPLALEVSMDTGSILYRTLGLFAVAFAGALMILAFVIWLVIRRGRRRNAAARTR